jgi:hypothetical protein
MGIPEIATVVNVKTEALEGDNIEGVLKRVLAMLSKDKEPEVIAAPSSDPPARKARRKAPVRKLDQEPPEQPVE